MPAIMKAKASLLSLFTLFMLVLGGCTTPVAIDPQTGVEQTARFVAGYFYGSLEADSDTIFRTTISKLDEHGYFRTGELHKNTYVTIYARKVGDQKVIARIRPLEPGLCELRIRIGNLGNLPESQFLYASIRDAL
jgi:hypothetical protein